RAVSSLLDWLAPITDVMPGTAAGSIATAAGAASVSDGGSPGVVDDLGGGAAVTAALGYRAVCGSVTAVLLRRAVAWPPGGRFLTDVHTWGGAAGVVSGMAPAGGRTKGWELPRPSCRGVRNIGLEKGSVGCSVVSP